MIRIRGIWDSDLNFLDIIADPVEPTFQEVLNDTGTAQFKCHSNDPAIQRQGWQSLLAYNNIVVMHDVQTNHYFPWVIEQRKRTTVASGESAEELQWTISGRGASALLTSAQVFPEYGLKQSSSDQRSFNFASKPGVWYNPSEWHAAHGSRWSTDVPRSRRPRGWPDPEAEWIWSSDPLVSAPLGTVFFRQGFYLPTPARVGFWATADNEFLLYVNSELVMSGRSWHTFQRFDIDLDAGNHYIGIRGTNDPTRSGTGLNPGGVLLSAWTVDPSTEKRIDRVTATDSSWLYRTSTGGPPGWDPGDIMSTLALEAKARGVDAMQHFNVNVTDNTDSAGIAWIAANRVDRSFDVGTDLLDVLTQLSETSCDFRMRYDESMFEAADKNHMLRLELFRHLGVDRSVHDITHGDPVILQKAFNAVGVDYDGDASGVKTALLIRTSDGWIEEVNTGASTRREGFLSLGSSTSNTHALSVANATFALAGVPQETSSLKTVAMSGHVPFHDFGVGDQVLGADENGDLIPWRVAAITATQDAENNVTYVPQLNDIRRTHVKRMARWLKSMAKGAAGGRIANAGPVLSLSEPPGQNNANEVVFSKAGPLTTGSTSAPYLPWVDQKLVEVIASVGLTGSSDSIISVMKNGGEITTVTIPAGELMGSVQVDVDYNNNSDYMTVSVTTASDAEDLSVQSRFH